MSDTMKILQMIENGEISPDEGIQMLSELPASSEQQPDDKLDTMALLSKIDNGEITAEEGLELLHTDTAEATTETEIEIETDFGGADETEIEHSPAISTEEMNRWKGWWKNLLYAGMGIAVLAAFWMSTTYQNNGYNFWFFCSWIPLALGILLVALATKSQTSPWIHVRVKSDTENVAISIPAPIGITKWGLKNFGHYAPQFDEVVVDGMIAALEDTTKNNAPIYIHVDEDDGEKVEIFIG